MRLANQSHLAYCTNIHPGSDWAETFASLESHTLAVRSRVAANEPFAIGLRLSARAAKELADPPTLARFRRWLDQNGCYVFTINGFPFGNFHGERVKEQVYRPDWSADERLDYTNLLFEILVELLPPGVAGSVSTLPGSFKRFVQNREHRAAIDRNLLRCGEHIERLSTRSGHDLHLGLEPEPLGLFETSAETVAFFDRLTDGQPNSENVLRRIGVNYDTCHLAVEFEEAATALARIVDAGLRLSKLHLSCALQAKPVSSAAIHLLERFCEDTYLHQVIAQDRNGELRRFEDLPEALQARANGSDTSEEWRVHFHIPLHAEPLAPLSSTANHLSKALDFLADRPQLCQHFEMETYTWAVLPDSFRQSNVVDQLAQEYDWILPELQRRGMR